MGGWLLLGTTNCANTLQGTEGDGGTLRDAAPLHDVLVAQEASVVDVPRPPRCSVQSLDGGPFVTALAEPVLPDFFARMSDGTVRAQGLNGFRRLGLGVDGNVNIAAPLEGLSNVEEVVVSLHWANCSRHCDGTVRCWGLNQFGLLGTGHAGDETCQGASAMLPCRARPTLVEGLDDVVQLSPGVLSFCALRGDGSVWCWGIRQPLLGNNLEEAPRPVRSTRVSDVVQLYAYNVGHLVRHRDGRYESIGVDQPATIPAEATIDSPVFSDHLCYRLPDATVRCVGANTYGQLGNGRASAEREHSPQDPGLRDVRAVYASIGLSCAVLGDRTVWCWGRVRDDLEAVPTSELCTTRDGAVRCARRPTRVQGIDQVERLFTSSNGACALRLDHSVWCWGLWTPDGYPARPTPLRW